MLINKLLSQTGKVIYLSTVVISFSLRADDSVDIKTIGQLDVLQSQTTYLKAIAARNKAREEAGVSAPFPASVTSGVNTSKKTGLPQIVKIVGHGRALSVTLMLADGTEITRKKGDALPGGYKLTNVSLDEVNIADAAGASFILSEARF